MTGVVGGRGRGKGLVSLEGSATSVNHFKTAGRWWTGPA